MLRLVPALALALLPLPALALEATSQIVLTFPGSSETNVVSYHCEGVETPISVSYVNANPTFIAFVPVAGETMLFVNVIAASGARYVSGQYEWWTKGADATLTDATAAEGTEPLSCTEAAETP